MPTKTEIREAYNSVAEDYDAYMEKTGHAGAQRKMVELLKDDIKGKVLDVGTGTGIITIGIAKKIQPFHIIGTDISEKMIEQAKANAKRAGLSVPEYVSMGQLSKTVYFYVDDIEHSESADNRFDTVICCLGMLWFIDKDKALSEMARICKDSGRIILIEEEGEPTRSRKSALTKKLQSFFSRLKKLETPISLAEIEEKIKGLGYQVTRIAKQRIDENHGFVGMVFELLPPYRHH